MSLPDLTGQNIENTYQRLVQTDGTNFYDGTGSLVILPSANTSSLVTTSSFNAFTSSINQFTSSYNTGSFTGSFTGGFNGTATTASYYQEVDPVFTAKSASLATTGSNIFRGNQTVTGSLYTTGSNELVGDTILSGTLQVQGKYPSIVGTSSVSIVGNVDLNGFLRFDPVTSNIDTTISASYIYVSGSTKDLYFSQNGSGYNNVTRLRWLEGNLYTGLLHGGAITSINSNTYQVASGSGIIVNLNASIPNDPYPTIQFLQWGNLTKTIDALSASFDQQFIAISSSGQIHAQGTPYFNGEVDRYIPVGIVLHQNRSSINGTKTQPSLGYGWKQRSNVFISAFGPLKLSGHSIATSSSLGLTVGSGTSFADGANYPTDPNNPSYVNDPGTNVSKIFRYWQSGSDWVYDTNNGAGYTTIDPTLYASQSAGGATLTAVPGGGSNRQYSIQRVFWYPNSVSKAIVVYYGNATYTTQTDAVTNIAFEPFTEAPNTAANAIYLGALVVRNNANFTDSTSYKVERGGLFRGVGGGGGGGGGTTSPGGSNTQIQYNNNGAFGGVPNLTWNGTTLLATGSFTGSFTGSLLGTSSYSITASYASNGGVTQILAGPNITLSPTNGLGQVTISSTGGGGIYGNTATGSYGSFYDTTTQTNPVINVIRSMSFNSTDITNGVSISGSVSPYNTYIKTENAGVYDIQFSAQLEKTSTGNTSATFIWLRKNGIDLAETNTALELSQNGKGVAAWNWFVNAAANDYFQIMWAADRTDLQLTATTPVIGPAVPSIIATVNRIDQFLSNTGSFTGSFTGSLFGTSSWAVNTLTASYLNNLTQNVEILGNVTIHGTASVDVLVTNYQSSSIIYSSGSTKFGDTLDDTHEFTGSIFTTGSISSTNTVTAITGSFSYLQGNSPIVVGDPVTFQQAITASSISASVIYGNGSNLTGISSSSFSATSSFTPNAIVTASATPGNYTMRLTKGDGSFFDVTLTTPAPTPPPVTDTGSFFTNATLNSDRIVFTKGDRSTLNLSLTSSYVLISQTSSFTQTSSFNTFTQSIQSSVDSLINSTSSFVQNSQTSSFVLNSQTSSMLEPYVLTSVTSSFVQNSQTSSFVQNSQTSSMLEPYVLTIVTSSMLAPYVLNSQTSSFVQNSQTSSMTVLSSSYSLTASYLNTPQFSSVVELGGTLTITNANYNTYLGKTIILTGSSAKNFNLNYSPTSPGLGDEFYIIQSGSGQVTTSGSGVTILSATGSLPKTRAEYSSMAVKHIGSNRWVVVGDITA